MHKFKSKDIIGILIPLVFGIILVIGTLKSAPITDPVAKWWDVIWGIGAICLGTYGAFNANKYIDSQIRTARKWKFMGWPTEREGYNITFARAVSVVFVAIGVTLLIKNFLI
jgi:hypothetical protein